ncbi:undecaprenyl-diphosphate phosphatase [soil metagenome]
MSILQAIVLAIIEGLTEFLPVSSTGHMIIGSYLMGIASDEFVKAFTVAIQLGAIASVVVLYWKRFFQTWTFYFVLLVGFIPVAIAGLLLNDIIDQLLERVDVVGWTLIIGGIILLFIDSLFSKSTNEENSTVTYAMAVKIGLFQCLGLIPGVSRSAATIIGGLTQGLTKKTAAEFSFLLAVPTMLAATGYKLLKFYLNGNSFGQQEITLLAIGNVVAFIVALLAVKYFIGILTRYGFKAFGFYRIIVGAILLLLYYFGAEIEVL